METRQNSLLADLNRLLILTLSVSGLLLKGFQSSDPLCSQAPFLWLWLPLLTRLESHLLRRADDVRVRNNGTRGFPLPSSNIHPNYHRSQV